MNSQPNLSAIEQKIQAAYQTIHPRASFAAALHAKVNAQARIMKTPPRLFFSFRLALFGLTLILILTTVLAIGPQTILARAKTVFGFIPGVGFVEEDTAVHLCQPVQVTQNGETLMTIDQAGGSGGELHILGSVTNGREDSYSFNLVDPEGNQAQLLNWRAGSEKGAYAFEAVYRLTGDSRTWILTSIPGGEFSAELPLCPGSQSAAIQSAASQPSGSQAATDDSSDASVYTPGDAVIREKGMIFKIQQVAQLEETTGIQIEMIPDETDPSASIPGRPYLRDVELKDDLGNYYPQQTQDMPGAIGGPVTSFEFDPFRPEASRGVLRIFRIDLDDETSVPFSLDLGGVPQPDQTWDLQGKPGSEYQIDGYTITLLSARYAKEHEAASFFSPVDRDVYTLEFTARVTSPTEDYTPTGAKLEIGNYNYMSTGSPDEDTLLLKAFFENPLTDQPVTGEIGWLGGTLEGPWILEWDLPK